MTDKKLPPIKFAALNDALLGRIETLVPMWLPDGKMQATEYFVHSVWRSEKTPSLSVSMKGAHIGCWQDHGGDHKGGDLVSLYAAIHGMSNGAAAVELARTYGLEDVAGVTRARGDAPQPERVAPAPTPVTATPTKRGDDEGWATVAPVPDHAPEATFWHKFRKVEDITHTATYAIDGALFGYVVRFRTSDGGKETLPYTWCLSARDGGSCWKWKQWDEPRPLYFPGGKSPKDGQTVIVVEGERKADVLQALLDAGAPGVYVVVGWPGGSKAWKKADWQWVKGAHVLAWPDCDGKREQLTNAEKAATPDPMAQIALQQAKPLLPAHKQVGMAAMLGIGAHLRDEHGCKVQLLPIPEPGTVADGWDCADAIETDGWDFDRVVALFGQAQPLQATPEPKADAPAGKNRDRLTDVGAPDMLAPDGADVGDLVIGRRLIPWWLACYYDEVKKRWNVSRKTIITVLERDADLSDILAYNELSNTVQARTAWPWPNSRAGRVSEEVDLLLGDYLTDKYGLPAISRQALQEAMQTVAFKRRFHPVRLYLQGLTWDGVSRIDKWLIHALGECPQGVDGKEATIKPIMAEYLAAAGRYWLLGMVYRVMEPGCKFDYCPVLEGTGGFGKSTLVEVLAGSDFYSDTQFEVGRGKEAQEQVQGLWVYEVAELAHFNKSEVGAIKAFISSKVDRYRAAYGATLSEFKRQCVLVGTTNENTYLRDRTGNRRFWPIPVRNRINIAWVRKWRDQLFAEAYALYTQTAPYTPTPDQEARLFHPMQESRLQETAVMSELLNVLTRAPTASGSGAVVNNLTDFVTLAQLCTALGADAAKTSPSLNTEIRNWMEHEGWEYTKKQINGVRAHGYVRPRNWPPQKEPESMEGAPEQAAPPADPSSTNEQQDTDSAPF